MKDIPMTRDYSQFFSSPLETQKPSLTPLQALGWQPHFAQQVSTEEMAAAPPVRITAVHRSALHAAGDGFETTLPPRPDATVGDWLMLDRGQPQNSRMLERTSLIRRRAPGTGRQDQLIAANIDTGFAVTSCNQDFNTARLERYLALMLEAQITPVIVLTKADLTDDPQGYVQAARAISDRAEVVALDARGGEVQTALAPWCKPGRTVAFLGSSGVGKSTLANALLGGQTIATQAIREDDAKGRHTTTHRELHKAPDGCLILDTPGMRELQLTDTADGISSLFANITERAAGCRFSNCRHDSEPGCAVLQAVEQGEIEQAQLDRWRKLMAEDAFNSATLAERRSRDKAFGKMVRSAVRMKDRKR